MRTTAKAIEVSVEPWSGGGQGGWRVVWFRERDGAGSYWYAATRDECEERAKGPLPHAIYWSRRAGDGASLDAATQTGMYDAW